MGDVSTARNAGFAKRLKALRKAKQLSQGDLGGQVGIHYTHIGCYEKERVVRVLLDTSLTERKLRALAGKEA